MNPAKKVEKPSSGTILAARARAICSTHTKEQRDHYIARGMSMMYARPADDFHSENFLTTPDHAFATADSR